MNELVNEKEMESESIKRVKKFIQQHTTLVIIGSANQEGSPHLVMDTSRVKSLTSRPCLSSLTGLIYRLKKLCFVKRATLR